MFIPTFVSALRVQSLDRKWGCMYAALVFVPPHLVAITIYKSRWFTTKLLTIFLIVFNYYNFMLNPNANAPISCKILISHEIGFYKRNFVL